MFEGCKNIIADGRMVTSSDIWEGLIPLEDAVGTFEGMGVAVNTGYLTSTPAGRID